MSAIGYVTRPAHADGFRASGLRARSVRAEGEVIPSRSKGGAEPTDCGALSWPVELGAGWIKTGEQSGKDYVPLGLAAPKLGPWRTCAKLGRAAGQDDDDVFALIWNPAD